MCHVHVCVAIKKWWVWQVGNWKVVRQQRLFEWTKMFLCSQFSQFIQNANVVQWCFLLLLKPFDATIKHLDCIILHDVKTISPFLAHCSYDHVAVGICTIIIIILYTRACNCTLCSRLVCAWWRPCTHNIDRDVFIAKRRGSVPTQPKVERPQPPLLPPPPHSTACDGDLKALTSPNCKCVFYY